MTAIATVITEQAVQDATNEAGMQARTAAKAFLQKHGDRDACGFAWVDVYGVRSNSKLGKWLQAAGFRKSYTGSLQLWNPSQADAPQRPVAVSVVTDAGLLRFEQIPVI